MLWYYVKTTKFTQINKDNEFGGRDISNLKYLKSIENISNLKNYGYKEILEKGKSSTRFEAQEESPFHDRYVSRLIFRYYFCGIHLSRFNLKTVFQIKPCCSDLKLDIYKVFQFTEGYFSLILTKSLVFRPKYFQQNIFIISNEMFLMNNGACGEYI